jgi:hypothetical protein
MIHLLLKEFTVRVRQDNLLEERRIGVARSEAAFSFYDQRVPFHCTETPEVISITPAGNQRHGCPQETQGPSPRGAT